MALGRPWEDSAKAPPSPTRDSAIGRTSGLANGAAGLFPPPTLSERCHRSLACRRVAVCRCAVLVMSKGQRPHPRRPNRGCMYLQEAANNGAVGNDVVIIVTPLTGRARGRGSLEDQPFSRHSVAAPAAGAAGHCLDDG